MSSPIDPEVGVGLLHKHVSAAQQQDAAAAAMLLQQDYKYMREESYMWVLSLSQISPSNVESRRVSSQSAAT